MLIAKQASEIAGAKTMRELTIAETHLVGAALGYGFPHFPLEPVGPSIPPFSDIPPLIDPLDMPPVLSPGFPSTLAA
jgi:hypothetical protein